MLAIFLLPLAILLYITASSSANPIGGLCTVFLTGLVIGFTSLAQPSMLFFPGVLLIHELFQREKMIRVFAKLAIIVVGMTTVIGPWSMRNYRIFDAWVLISTNGGDVFYRANNPLATGGWQPAAAISLGFDIGEVERDKKSYELGKQWIRENPGAFLILALRKQKLFFDDDSAGAYHTFQRSSQNDSRYFLFRAVSNLYWWGLWALAFAAFSYHLKAWGAQIPGTTILILSLVYLLSIHSVYESHHRYHVPLIGVLAILVSLLAYPIDGSTQKEEKHV